jgi:hypothetical protein
LCSIGRTDEAREGRRSSDSKEIEGDSTEVIELLDLMDEFDSAFEIVGDLFEHNDDTLS